MLAVGSTDDKKGSYAIQVDKGSAECGAYIALESSRKVGAAAITSRLNDVKAQREDADVEIEILYHIRRCIAASQLAQRIKRLANGWRDVKGKHGLGLAGSTGEIRMPPLPRTRPRGVCVHVCACVLTSLCAYS